VVDVWLAIHDPDGPDPGSERPSELHTSRLLGGRVRLDGELAVADAAEVQAELEAIYQQLWRDDQTAPDGDPDKLRPYSQRNAAALVEMARRSSATQAGGADHDDTGGRPARKPTLIVITDIDALAGQRGATAELDDGTLLPAQLLSEWACDSGIGRVVMAGGSLPTEVGTITYTTSAGQRRALIARDKGCATPGCGRKARWCDAHHVIPFPDGPTDLSNLILLCKRHHRQVHRGIIRLLPNDGGGWRVVRADGTPLRTRPPPTWAA
jgi:5-methylcytosine-specific restriction protein A